MFWYGKAQYVMVFVTWHFAIWYLVSGIQCMVPFLLLDMFVFSIQTIVSMVFVTCYLVFGILLFGI